MRLLSILPLVGLLACASATPIPDQDRARLENELTGQPRWLKISVYQGPFWSDDTKLLLSPTPPTELALFSDASGNDVPAPPPTGVVPAGRKVRIEKIELPTGTTVMGRLPYSPRYNPWVYVSVEGVADKPGILVLRSDLKSHDQFVGALDRLLTTEDPNPRIDAYPDEIKKAIREKNVVREMDAEAVTMAWGSPDRRSIDEGKRTEVWSYGKGKRVVTLSDGHVSRVEVNGPPAGTVPPAP